MADKQLKRIRAASSSNPALDIAGIHWLALEVEQAATSAYVTRPDRLDRIVDSLQDVVKALRKLGQAKHGLDEGDCPPPFIECDDLCVMLCDQIQAQAKAESQTKPQKPGKRKKT